MRARLTAILSATAGSAVVYRIEVSASDRGTIRVQVAACGGRVEVERQDRHDRPA